MNKELLSTDFAHETESSTERLKSILEHLSKQEYMGIVRHLCTALIPLVGRGEFTVDEIRKTFPAYKHHQLTELNGMLKTQKAGYRVLQIMENGHGKIGSYHFSRE